MVLSAFCLTQGQYPGTAEDRAVRPQLGPGQFSRFFRRFFFAGYSVVKKQLPGRQVMKNHRFDLSHYVSLVLMLCTLAACGDRQPASGPTVTSPTMTSPTGTNPAPPISPIDTTTAGTPLIATVDPAALNPSLPDGCSAHIVVDDAPVPDHRALQLHIDHAYQPAWQAQLSSPVSTAGITKGDVVALSCWMRQGGDATSPADPARFLLRVQQPVDPWDAVVETKAVVGQTWQHVTAWSIADRDWPAGGLLVSIHLGHQGGTVELAGMTVRDLGPDVDRSRLPVQKLSWPGMAADAPWRAEAARRIEQYREAPLDIAVTDPAGHPLPGVAVTVDQVRTKFTIGSVIDWQDSPDGVRERDLAAQLFSRATIPVYWGDAFWPDHRDDILRIAEWDRDHGMTTRAHVLVYPTWRFNPPFLAKLAADPKAFQDALIAHIRDLAAAMRPCAPRDCDVTNELRDCTEFTDILGKSAVAQWYAEARRDLPGTKLALNENTILTAGGDTAANQDTLIGWYQYLKSQGQAPDILGFQGHFDNDVTAPETVWAILDRFSRETAAEFQITEFDLDTLDEAGQAAYTRDFLTAVFAEERVAAITLWGFWEGDHWRPHAALWRQDWTPKPNALVLQDLLKQWSTHAHLVTGPDGHVKISAFLGDLLIKADANGRAASATVRLDVASQPTAATVVIGK
jgi:GH35 family endo-1,4-beta-xylanase